MPWLPSGDNINCPEVGVGLVEDDSPPGESRKYFVLQDVLRSCLIWMVPESFDFGHRTPQLHHCETSFKPTARDHLKAPLSPYAIPTFNKVLVYHSHGFELPSSGP